MAISTGLAAASTGATLLGGAMSASAQSSALQLQTMGSMLNAQTQKTQNAEQLNRSVAANMVAGSANGGALGDQSMLRMTTQDFHNYGEDSQNLNTQEQLYQANEEAGSDNIWSTYFMQGASSVGNAFSVSENAYNSNSKYGLK